MAYPIAYDVTRLGSRLFSASPNGVHRVDASLADHILSLTDREISAAWFPRPLIYRIISREAGREVLEGVDRHFDERDDPSLEPQFQRIKHWVLGDAEPRDAAARLDLPRRKRFDRAISWAWRHRFGASAPRALPHGARYLNVSHYGLAAPAAFDWLSLRPDVRAVFFFHDMLPLETPEYFRPVELKRHQTRLRNLARHGAGAIVSTQIMKASLGAHMASLGRADFPIVVAPPPVAPIFRQPAEPDPELAARAFFIQCGTIEPRKNHLTMLHVWRELAARHGEGAPKLLLVGARGWENENIIDLLERSPGLRRHVLEISGLPTPVLRRLLASARALLMPSFAEGYGLPLVEALAAGACVIASDIPVFREIAGDAFTPFSPIDGVGWLNEIERRSDLRGSSATFVPQRRPGDPEPYFAAIRDFVDSL